MGFVPAVIDMAKPQVKASQPKPGVQAFPQVSTYPRGPLEPIEITKHRLSNIHRAHPLVAEPPFGPGERGQ